MRSPARSNLFLLAMLHRARRKRRKKNPKMKRNIHFMLVSVIRFCSQLMLKTISDQDASAQHGMYAYARATHFFPSNAFGSHNCLMSIMYMLFSRLSQRPSTVFACSTFLFVFSWFFFLLPLCSLRHSFFRFLSFSVYVSLLCFYSHFNVFSSFFCNRKFKVVRWHHIANENIHTKSPSHASHAHKAISIESSYHFYARHVFEIFFSLVFFLMFFHFVSVIVAHKNTRTRIHNAF